MYVDWRYKKSIKKCRVFYINFLPAEEIEKDGWQTNMIDGQIVRKTDVQTDTDKSICGYRVGHGVLENKYLIRGPSI